MARADPSGFSVDNVRELLIRAELVTGGVLTGVSTVGPLGLSGKNIQGLAFDPSSGQLYAFSDSTAELLTIDPSTGTMSVVGPLVLSSITVQGTGGLTFDDTGKLFLSAGNSTIPGSALYEVNPSSGTASFIGSHGLSVPIEAIAYGAGALYGASGGSAASLFLINSSSGTASIIGSLGIDLALRGQLGMSFDANGTLWLVEEGPALNYAGIYVVDTGTGVMTFQNFHAYSSGSYVSLAIPVATPSVPSLSNPGFAMLAIVLICAALTVFGPRFAPTPGPAKPFGA